MLPRDLVPSAAVAQCMCHERRRVNLRIRVTVTIKIPRISPEDQAQIDRLLGRK